MPTQAERTEATRDALIAAARELFAERGYAAVSVDGIAAEAGVTIGALYHQFGSKEELFRAVYMELVQAVAAHIHGTRDASPGSDLVGNCEAYLDACVDPAFQRIVLRDAPALLGGDLIQDGALGLVEAELEAARRQGRIADQPIVPLARMIVASLKEAGAIIANADDPDGARAEVGANLRQLVGNLERGSEGPS